MNIVILDDQLDYQSHVEKKIHECFPEKDVILKIYKFENVSEMILSLDKQSYTMAFIELKADHNRGIQAAKLLQQLAPECRIIFISDIYFRLSEVSEVAPIDYLLKPIDTKQFSEALKKAMEWYSKQNVTFFIRIKSIKMRKFFTVDDIKYVTTRYKDLEIVTMDDEHYLCAVKSRNKLREILRPRWFMQVNCSTLVNMKCIDFMTSQNVILQTREVFSASRRYLMDNHLKYDKFLRDENRTYGYSIIN